MEIHAIVAIDQNNAIGKDGKLPWHLASELKHFKQITMGYPMVLGRTTFESFKKPLPGRDHLVLSSTLKTQHDHVYTFTSKDELLKYCKIKKYEKIFICGGATIYQLFSHEIAFWHISQIQIKSQYPDTFFNINLTNDFKLQSQKNYLDELSSIAWIYNLYHRCK